MNHFAYSRATDVADAVRQIAADPEARFIAGGTNLIDLIKENVACPSRLIDISRLPLDAIEETRDGGLRIGALVPNSDVASRRFYLAGTYICQQAMLAGRIDIYPEYTGTALTGFASLSPCPHTIWPSAA